MGNTHNNKVNPKILTEEEIASIISKTGYTREDILQYNKKFMAICPDGEFTKDKFVKYFSEMRPDRETETFCAQMFNGFDSDQSGKVSFEEFLLALKLVSNNDPREKLRFAFKMYDIDQNSKLDINELEKLIIGINEFSGHKQSNSTGEPKKVARNLLSKFDKDENGYLTEDEFIDELLTFPTLHALRSFSLLRNGLN